MTNLRRTLVIVLFLGAVAACGRGGATGAGPPAAARPPTAVEIVTVEPKPVERTSEFVGTIKSRRSTSLQPQVEGFLTVIAVRSGDRVQPGTLLMEIDSRPQQAGIASLEAIRAAREVDVNYAGQEAQRAQTLLTAGAASQQDADRALNALKAAEAQALAVDEQISQLRTELAYYRVTAPTSGILGDIPVHVGDRVTKTTLLTTIDENAGLEVYLNIPVQQAPGLRIGLPVRLFDDKGQAVATERIAFVSPSVDEATQTVLAKLQLSVPSGFRPSQYVRAHVIWNTDPGLTVPVTAAIRVNGAYFVFVAETAEGRGAGAPDLVAHQRAVTLGPVVGNDYLVLTGLKPGEKLIVSGIQKIGDGAPVRPSAGPQARNLGPDTGSEAS
jgi:RND family efflux transporter MFP subunit